MFGNLCSYELSALLFCGIHFMYFLDNGMNSSLFIVWRHTQLFKYNHELLGSNRNTSERQTERKLSFNSIWEFPSKLSEDLHDHRLQSLLPFFMFFLVSSFLCSGDHVQIQYVVLKMTYIKLLDFLLSNIISFLFNQIA